MPKLRPRRRDHRECLSKEAGAVVTESESLSKEASGVVTESEKPEPCHFVIDRTCTSDTSVFKGLEPLATTSDSQEPLTQVQSADSRNSENLQSACTVPENDQPTKTTTVTAVKVNKKPSKRLGLSSSLQDGIKETLYITGNRKQKPAVLESQSAVDKLLESSVLPSDVEKMHSLPPYEVSLHQTRKQRQKERAQTKGKPWFDMKAPEMTEQKKNDLSVLQMRRVLDPKHFYKNPDIRALPKFFQMGKIVEDASDFYSARIPKKQRKSTLVDELLEDTEFRRYNKRKYVEITERAQSSHTRKGAAKHMKRLKKGKK